MVEAAMNGLAAKIVGLTSGMRLVALSEASDIVCLLFRRKLDRASQDEYLQY